MKQRRVGNKSRQKIIQQEELPLASRANIPIKIRQTAWERTRDHPIIWFLNVLAALLAIVLTTVDAFREPEILPSQAQIDYPFAARFSLHNPSIIFAMTDMRLNCVLLKVKRAEIPNLEGGIPVDDGIIATILGGKTIEYACPIQKAIELDLVVQATIRIDAKFKTIGYERTTKSELFNWDISSRQWIKGEIIN